MKTKFEWPWSHHRLEKLRRELLNRIESQVNAAGVQTQRRRPGLRMEIDGRDMRVWLSYYRDQHWWRLTCGYGCDEPGWEHTIAAFRRADDARCEEIDVTHRFASLPACFARLKRYRWPLFAEGRWAATYPSYAMVALRDGKASRPPSRNAKHTSSRRHNERSGQCQSRV